MHGVHEGASHLPPRERGGKVAWRLCIAAGDGTSRAATGGGEREKERVCVCIGLRERERVCV